MNYLSFVCSFVGDVFVLVKKATKKLLFVVTGADVHCFAFLLVVLVMQNVQTDDFRFREVTF